ncbi:response regulator [Paucibacter sp. O1-1]|nr:response regulator [Paucibacter sp. O1-1]MDA3829198.1 response regulator [Paucibacter sp. O1-1]
MNARILIVEDQADIRRLIRWALEDSGHRLHEAANGALALQIVQAMRPDLMLIDVVMPGEISGLDLCKQIEARPDPGRDPAGGAERQRRAPRARAGPGRRRRRFSGQALQPRPAA